MSFINYSAMNVPSVPVSAPGSRAQAYLAQRPADPAAWEAIALWMKNAPLASFTSDDYYVWNTNVTNDRWLSVVVSTIVDYPDQPAVTQMSENGMFVVEVSPAQPGRSAAEFAEPLMWAFAYPFKDAFVQTLQNLSVAAGYGNSINWDRYARLAAEAHFRQYGQFFRSAYTNSAAWLNMIVDQAQADYPNLVDYRAAIAPGSDFYIQAEAKRQSAAEADKKAGQAGTMMLLSVVLAPVAVALFAPAVAASTIAPTSVLQGAELAALVESGTVGVEGAFLEAAAISGSQVVYSTATGALVEAITPAGESIAFDATIDPFTQFDVATFEPTQSVVPNEPITQPPPPTEPTAQPSVQSKVTKAATDYAKKLALSELNKLVGGAAQSPGAKAALAQGKQGVASEQESADITPLMALALVAGAYIYSKRK